MTEIDLSLVPIDDLLGEVCSRCDFYAATYQLQNESGPNKTIYTHWKDKAWFGNLACVAALQSDLLKECQSKDKRE